MTGAAASVLGLKKAASVEIILVFARTKETIQAEGILEEAGLSIRVMPLPSAIRAGCGVCLHLPEAQFREASARLKEAKIPVESVFARAAAGGRSIYAPYIGDLP